MSEEEQAVLIDGARHEYEQVSENIRHYSNLRFAVFSVFVALMAGITYLAFSTESFTLSATPFPKIGGLLFTLAFWCFDERITKMFEHFGAIADELEEILGYRQFHMRPPGTVPVPKAKCVTRAVFSALVAFWVCALFWL